MGILLNVIQILRGFMSDGWGGICEGAMSEEEGVYDLLKLVEVILQNH